MEDSSYYIPLDEILIEGKRNISKRSNLKNSRRGRIIELLSTRKSDDVILAVLNKEFQIGVFSTTNKQALSGTK